MTFLKIVVATPPFGLGQETKNDDLWKIELKKMACANAKAKGLPSQSPKILKPYTPTLNGMPFGTV